MQQLLKQIFGTPKKTPQIELDSALRPLKKRKVYTRQQLVTMPKDEFNFLTMALHARAWGMIIQDRYKVIRFYERFEDRALVFEWE